MPRTPSPALTDAEARVMAVLWDRQTATVGDVVVSLAKQRPVSYSTVQTILRILEEKGTSRTTRSRARSSIGRSSTSVRRGGARCGIWRDGSSMDRRACWC